VVFAATVVWSWTCKLLGLKDQELKAERELQIPTVVREVDFDVPTVVESPQFSVWFFYSDLIPRNFIRGVDAQTALHRAKEITEWPGAQDGSIRRVIVTNEDNQTIFEWTHAQGVRFP
jgi:hypothetical protein